MQKTGEISARLNTQFIGRQLYCYSVLSSTMNKAREKALRGAPEGTTIIADKQTAGRGRIGRTWLSPQGNIALSIILKPDLEHLPSLVMVASLAVLQTIKKITNTDAVIKWPNDILIKGKKVSGILIESEVRDKAVNYTIIGIGLNMRLDTAKYPEISTIATSLWHIKPQSISKPELIATLLSELEQLYLAVKNCTPIHQEWRSHLDTLGKSVEIKCGDVIEQGIAEDVMANGNLLLRQANGNTIEILAGDVTVLKR